VRGSVGRGRGVGGEGEVEGERELETQREREKEVRERNERVIPLILMVRGRCTHESLMYMSNGTYTHATDMHAM